MRAHARRAATPAAASPQRRAHGMLPGNSEAFLLPRLPSRIVPFLVLLIRSGGAGLGPADVALLLQLECQFRPAGFHNPAVHQHVPVIQTDVVPQALVVGY